MCMREGQAFLYFPYEEEEGWELCLPTKPANAMCTRMRHSRPMRDAAQQYL